MVRLLLLSHPIGVKPAHEENRYRVKLRRAHKIFSTP